MNEFNLDQLTIFAARSGNNNLLSERIAAGGNANYYDSRHGSALIEAIRYKNIESIKILIQNGANLNIEYKDGIGPLEIALRNPDSKTVYLLLCSGAKLRRKTRPYYKNRLEKCLIEINEEYKTKIKIK